MKKGMLSPAARPLWKEASSSTFDMEAIMARLYELTGAETRTELAGFLGVRLTSLELACQRGMPRAAWLMGLLLDYGVSPRWVLFGTGNPVLPGASAEDSPEEVACLRGALADVALVQRLHLVEHSAEEDNENEQDRDNGRASRRPLPFSFAERGAEG